MKADMQNGMVLSFEAEDLPSGLQGCVCWHS